jgi:hypothetical protein
VKQRFLRLKFFGSARWLDERKVSHKNWILFSIALAGVYSGKRANDELGRAYNFAVVPAAESRSC